MTRTLAWLNPHDPLPPSAQALTEAEGANGLVAAGTDISRDRLLEAYSQGIFPWFSEGEPVLWWTPDPRMVLMLDEFKVSTSFRKTLRRTCQDPDLQIVMDRDFHHVMRACAAPRHADGGTWINPMMIEAYRELHAQGLAHSIELMRRDESIGGLYCVSLGQMVFGESMFSRESGASKITLAALVGWLQRHGGQMIDCQQRTAHLASLGGREIARAEFESMMQPLVTQSPLPWALHPVSKTDLARWE